MALNAGDAATGTGLAGDIIAAAITALDAEFSPDFDETIARQALEPVADAIANAVVDHLKANMDLKLDGHTGADPFTQAAPGAVD